MRIALTGWAVQVPPGTVHGRPEDLRLDDTDPRTLLGRRGLGAKEPATRLALAAVHRLPGLTDRPAATAVVAASALGNVETVCTVARQAHLGGVGAVSPLTAPNASPNVIASSVALRFGLTGPNVMLCNRSGTGVAAVHTAARLLRSGRADRAVVVAVEPADDVARGLCPDVRALAVALLLRPARPGDAIDLETLLDRLPSTTPAAPAPDQVLALVRTATAVRPVHSPST